MLFVAIFALQIVPIQVALIPLLQFYSAAHLSGTFWAIWISHSIFALPLAIFLLHNFMKEIPAELIEAARVDGAGHVKIFFRVLLPLIVPAIAAFGIFQFLWVWNDLLVALTFAPQPEIAPRHRPGRGAGRHPRAVLGAARPGGVRRGDRAGDRVPVAAALLRPRAHGRQCQGIVPSPERQSGRERWWADAVIYQIYPRSFADSDGDGMGDLPGIAARLADVAALGVDAVWLSPFYRSPQDDAGYDVSDYRAVDPLFGTPRRRRAAARRRRTRTG